MADIELSADPESTWGATEEYKAAWHAEYGSHAPNKSASKAEWVEWATNEVHGENRLTEEEAEATTRDELADRFGGDVGIVSAPSVPNSSVSGQGAGTAPEGNVPGDPADAPSPPPGSRSGRAV